MKSLIKIHRGFHIYQWSTGKIEAFRQDGRSAGMAAIGLETEAVQAVIEQIDAKLED